MLCVENAWLPESCLRIEMRSSQHLSEDFVGFSVGVGAGGCERRARLQQRREGVLDAHPDLVLAPPPVRLLLDAHVRNYARSASSYVRNCGEGRVVASQLLGF